VVYKVDANGLSYVNSYDFGPLLISNGSNIQSPIVNMAYRNARASTTEVIVGFSISRNSSSPNTVFTRLFDSSTGAFVGLTHTIVSFNSDIMYDLEFSPSGNYLYYATYFNSVLYRAELDPATGALAGTARFMIHSAGNLRGGGLKLAPDGYIYHISDAGLVDFHYGNSSQSTVTIGRIKDPDQPNSTYEPGVIQVAHAFAYSFPEFVTPPAEAVANKLLTAVYFNPKESFVDFNLTSLDETEVTIEILGMEGNRVVEQRYHVAAGQEKLSLYLGNLPAGVYLYRLSSPQEQAQGKFYLTK